MRDNPEIFPLNNTVSSVLIYSGQDVNNVILLFQEYTEENENKAMSSLFHLVCQLYKVTP